MSYGAVSRPSLAERWRVKVTLIVKIACLTDNLPQMLLQTGELFGDSHLIPIFVQSGLTPKFQTTQKGFLRSKRTRAYQN
jgi:hypothetical protein